jgi:flavin-dependent dehydrogenase
MEMLVKRHDVVVVGGSSAGVAAALAAGRLRTRVALLEDMPVVGGMLANGVSNADAFSLESLGGIFEEYRRLGLAFVTDRIPANPPADPAATGPILDSVLACL